MHVGKLAQQRAADASRQSPWIAAVAWATQFKESL